MKTLLLDKAYTKLNKDPTNTITSQKTKTLIEKSNIFSKIKLTLKPTNSLPLRLYSLPKIHKLDNPLQPIVSAINSPTYNFSRFLAQELKSLIGKSGTHRLHLKNPKNLIASCRHISELRCRIPLHTGPNQSHTRHNQVIK